MTASEFDIYQTESGYTAVTNDVRRAILNALAKKERQLPDLVRITKKAKPTLSSVHMRELLAQGLVEELSHPTDKRKKIYRLIGRRIGSSNVPVGELRSAIKHYVTMSPLAARLPLTVTFEALAAAPRETPEAVTRAQAYKLGELAASLFADAERNDLITGLASLLEREGLARPLRLDLELLRLELELGTSLPADATDARLAGLIAGFVEGAARAHGKKTVRVETIGNRRFALELR